jgi:hypothetical protein
LSRQTRRLSGVTHCQSIASPSIAGPGLELDQVEARVAEDQEVELEQPPGGRIEEIDQGPGVERIAVGQRPEGVAQAVALVGVGRGALGEDASARQGHG